jgi:hypothetical protein
MKSVNPQISCLILATILFASQNALTATVYQWTDDEGIVHFSDTPPKGNESLEIQEMEFVTYVQNDADNDEYSIMNQLERMSEWRRQTADERMARKQLHLEEKRLAQESHANRYNNNLPTRTTYSQPVYYPYSGYFGGFNSFNRFNQRRGHHWGQFSGPGKGHHGGFKGRTNKLAPHTSNVGSRILN